MRRISYSLRNFNRDYAIDFCLFVCFCFGPSNVEFGERGTWPLMSPAYGRCVFTVRTERGEVSLVSIVTLMIFSIISYRNICLSLLTSPLGNLNPSGKNNCPS